MAVTASGTASLRGWPLATGLALGAVAAVAVVVAVASPRFAPLAAGSVLLMAGFAVMAPCSTRMALTMSQLVDHGLPPQGSGVRRTALLFALGYVGFYLPVAVALGGVARALGDWAWVAVMLAAALSLVLGLAALGTVDLGRFSVCRGPQRLPRSGRASLQRPLTAGVAFGQYCATCCGPYLLALGVIAGGSRSFEVGSGLVVAYAVVMALPFLAPAFLNPVTYSDLGRVATRLGPRLERVTGLVLVAMSIALVPSIVAAVVA